MLRKLRQVGEGLDEVLLVTDRVRAGEADALDAIDLMDGFDELHEGAFATDGRELMAAIQIDDLAQQRHFLHSATGQALHLFDDFRDGPAALFTARVGHNAEGAFHVAALHDAHEGGGLAILELMIANGVL